MELIYHYTSHVHLERILNDGFLKISEADKKAGFKPAIWFSKNKLWEPTATKAWTNGKIIHFLTPAEQLYNYGCVRFGLKFTPELLSWKKYKHIGKIPLWLYHSMEEVGIEKGANPDDWFCMLRNIPLSECVSLEQFDGSEWLNMVKEEVDAEHPPVLNP